MNAKNSEEEKGVVLKTGTSPAEMITIAVSEGADLEELEKLLTLQERWEANEARKAYHKSMSAFKENPPQIDKDRSVGYNTDKGKVGYRHASLANAVDKVTAELSKHGLSVAWDTKQDKGISVTCCITHVMGHTERTTLTADADSSGSKNSIQAIGSTITYLQRYTLFSALGLAASEIDDDGFASEQEKISDKEMHIIRDNLIEADAKEGPLLKYLGIEKLEDMPKSDFNKALAAIEARKKKNQNENI